MARPIKKGLDYFPLNVTLRGKIEYIQCMYGMLGVMVIISLWQRIYENSYYIEYGKKSALTFSKDFTQLSKAVDEKKPHWEIFDEIVKQAVAEGIFDKDVYEKFGVLTSRGIQENYLKAKEKSTKIEFDKRYLLLSDGKFSVSSPKTGVSSPKTGVITTENATEYSRVEESKAEYSKGEERTSAPSTKDKPEVTFSKEEIQSLADEFGKETAAEYTERVKAYCAETGKRYKNYAQTARKWIKEDLKNAEFSKKSGKTRVKKTKFSNYTDTNRIDYEAYERRIFADMMDEKERK